MSFSNPQIHCWQATDQGNANIVDERSFYIQNNRNLGFFKNNIRTPSENVLVAPINNQNLHIRTLNELDQISRNWATSTSALQQPEAVLTECGLLGHIGLTAGPHNHLIDSCALKDQFVVGIPLTPDHTQTEKPGHIERALAAGHKEVVAADNPAFVFDLPSREQFSILWDQMRT